MLQKPRLLDLYCKAGGGAVGYAMAGFEVVGVDNEPQPRYPFEFHQADALKYLKRHWQKFDVIHASPPCQRYSRITRLRGNPEDHADLLEPTRKALKKTGKPYVLENIPDAPMSDYLMLCGTMFGLRIFRHRHFECHPILIFSPATCNHYSHSSNGGRNGDQSRINGEFITVVGNCSPIEKAKAAMQINWMNRKELANAIPPSYTKYIGEQLLQVLVIQK